MHKDYLLKNNKEFFTSLLIQGKLYQHCAEVENQARDMFDTLVEQLKEAEGVTEQLKEENQMVWVRKISFIYQTSNDVVVNDLIYK